MKKLAILITTTLAVIVFALFGVGQPQEVYAVTQTTTFDSTTDLTDLFNDDGSPVFSNQATGGINNTGSVNVPVPSNDLWTTKQGYSVTGEAGSVYTFSAYFKVAQNSGWGNLGFTDASSSTGDFIGQPATGIGANFHGGGGAFVNNGVQTTLSWPPDLVLGNWYWFEFQVTSQGSNTFDLRLQIWNTDSTGVLGTMKTEETQTGVVNADLGEASTIHAFFSAAGSRMDTIDSYTIDLQGSTIIEEGAPVVISNSSTTDVGSTTASFGGEVTADNGAAVTARGVCWSTSENPTVSDSCTTDGTGIGSFTSNITGLNPGTTYFVRTYATNSVGTSYGTESSFTTSDSGGGGDPESAMDSDGLDDTIEAEGPNGGDANGDGSADNTQNRVGSMLNAATGNYVVIETDSNCGSISSAAMNSEVSLAADADYSYPEGLMSFALTGCAPGATATVIHYYYGIDETNNFVLRKFNSNTTSYSTISDATIETVEIGGESVVRVQYQITDGGELDLDGTANGSITDPAGPGLPTPEVPDTGYGSSSGALNFLLAGVFGLLALALANLCQRDYRDQLSLQDPENS